MPHTKRETRQKARWYKVSRCSICTNFIWLRPIVLKDPVEAPEPRGKWVLCRSCYEALLVEMRRSSMSIHSPNRLRVAMGLVAAERSPRVYNVNAQQTFQREFMWGMWLIILFALMHAVIFVIILTVAR